MILQFNFLNYFDNPVVRFCHEFNKRKVNEPITVLTLDDCKDDINKLRHSRKALSKNRLSFIGDELRLYYSLQYDNLLYIDGDALLKNPRELDKYKNCTEYCGKKKENGALYINNGTFFKSQRDCLFNKYYFDVYENNDVPIITNISVFTLYPMKTSEVNGVKYSGDMALINPSCKHFYMSSYREIKHRCPDITTIKYTLDPDFNPVGIKGLVVKLINHTPSQFQVRANGVLQFFNTDDPELGTRDELFNLYKEQMNYTYGRELKYEEIGHEYK